MPTSSQEFTTFAATPLVTTAETVVMTFTIPPENTGVSSVAEGIGMSAEATMTTGTGTTAVILRVRFGSLAGAVVQNLSETTVIASTVQTADIQVIDSTANYPAGQTYVLTAQQVGATGNATMQYASMITEAVNSSGG